MKKYKKQHILAHPYEQVGIYLATLRLKAGFTQKFVSEALDYSSPQFISNFERGISLPPLKKLRTLVKLYGADVSELLKHVMAAEKQIFLDNMCIPEEMMRKKRKEA